MERFRLDGKTLAISGASSGLGRHFAGTLAQAGAHVVLGARRTAATRERAQEIHAAGGRATGLELDVLDQGSAERFLDAAFEVNGRLDVLINNAGVQAGAKTYTMIDEQDWDHVFNTNLKGAWLLSKLYSERVAACGQPGGNIINIASITAWRTIKGQFPYAVSKAALVKATEIMALEGAKLGIRVNALAPGYVLTEISRVLLESERAESFVKRVPMRRFGAFEDFDGPLLLLASDASAYMTGATLVVDGGHLCAEL